MRLTTLQSKMDAPSGFTTGFDYLRIGLSVAVLLFHSISITSGTDAEIWASPLRLFPAAMLPMFFALSGYLVSGSLQRVPLHQFVTLRLVRLIPALAVEIVISACIIGSIVTSLPFVTYIQSRTFLLYFLNIIGDIHFALPGVFDHNPLHTMNLQLWTIPYEFECYATLALLSVTRVLKLRSLFLGGLVLASIFMTVRIFAVHTISHTGHVPGRMLVASFLCAVILYLYRDVVPYSNKLGVVSAVLSAVLLEFPETCYLAAFPVAYFTIWLGLMRPPAIPFGDLSYGVYLFHFPIEQTVVFALPDVRAWWLLSLIAIPLTTLCAWLSWTFIEHPTLVRKKRILAASDRVFAFIGTAGQLRRGRSTSLATDHRDVTTDLPQSVAFDLDPKSAA